MKLHIFASGLLLAVSFTACSGEKKETTEKEGVETVLPVFSYLGSGGEYLGKERGYSAERSKNSPIGFV